MDIVHTTVGKKDISMKRNKLMHIVFRILAGLLGLSVLIIIFDIVINYPNKNIGSIGFIIGGLTLGPLFLYYAIKGKLFGIYDEDIWPK